MPAMLSVSSHLPELLEEILGSPCVVRYGLLAKMNRNDLASREGEAAGTVSLFVLVDGGECWLVATDGEAGCVECVLHWLSLSPASSPADGNRTEENAAMALDSGLLESGILSFAERIMAEDRSLSIANRLDLQDGQVSLHSYLPHPWCSCHGADSLRHGDGRTPAETPDASDATYGQRAIPLPELSKRVMPLAFDPGLGLVRTLSHHAKVRFHPLSVASLYPFGSPASLEFGYGRSSDRHRNPVIATLEAIERYLAMEPRNPVEVVKARYADLGPQALDLRQLVAHEEEAFEQARLTRFSDETEYDWIWAYSFREQRYILIPLQLAYYGHGGDQPRGGRILYETSSGAATGGTFEEAILHGIFELVERDAFLTSWYGHRMNRRVVIGPDDIERYRPLLLRLEAEGLRLEVRDISVDLPVAALAAFIIDPEQRLGRACSLAAGAHLDPMVALQGAIDEVVSMIGLHDKDDIQRNCKRARALLDGSEQVLVMEDHDMLGWPLEAIEWMGISATGTERSWKQYREDHAAAEPPAGLASLIQRLIASGTDVIVADLSWAPFAAAGLHCAKVICPGLLPMTFGHRNRRINWDRVARHSDQPVESLRSPPLLRPHPFP